MENFGTEIGQKMRSAVKAKLLELGTGDSAGYIDDELPDYIMIMVANKRSKQQMIVDLNLFLGNQTELFVTWLHEVLQKLQEVTLPAIAATNSNNKKRKTSQKEEKEKKDKRVKEKKDKSKTNKRGDKDAENPTTTSTMTVGTPVSATAINSITDVFAEELLEKAKKDMDLSTENSNNIKKGKGGVRNNENTLATKAARDFDIPTISEISSTTTDGGGVGVVLSGNREKDLAELAEIQRRIYAAKKHLKQLGEVEDAESEDEDFLNLKDDGSADEFDETGDLVEKAPKVTVAQSVLTEDAAVAQELELQNKSPIVFSGNEAIATLQEPTQTAVEQSAVTEVSKPTETEETTAIERAAARSPLARRSRDRERREPPPTNKRPVHERLGIRQQQSNNEEEEAPRSRRLRQDKELYVPTFRRREPDNDKRDGREKRTERERGRERVREPDRSRERERERSRGERDREARQRPSLVRRVIGSDRRRSSSADSAHSDSPDLKAQATIQRHRIGSRVIVAPVKPAAEPTDDEEEKPLNSVIKIKPRAQVSPSKQASKNLLMRAMAEAQRSTILVKSAKKDLPKPAKRLSERLGESASNVKRLKRTTNNAGASSGAELFRRTTQNLIIEIEGGANKRKRRRYKNEPNASTEHVLPAEMEQEYVPALLSDRDESDTDMLYVPKSIKQQRHAEQKSDEKIK